MTTARQRLRQKVTDALARARDARAATGLDFTSESIMRGVQAGSVATLEAVIDWIDEIVEGKDENGITPH